MKEIADSERNALKDILKEIDEGKKVENSNCESLMIIELSGQKEIQDSKRSGKTGDQGKTIQGLQPVLRTLQDCTK